MPCLGAKSSSVHLVDRSNIFDGVIKVMEREREEESRQRKMQKTSDQMHPTSLKTKDETALDRMLKITDLIFNKLFYEPKQFQVPMVTKILRSLTKTILGKKYHLYAKIYFDKMKWPYDDDSPLCVGRTARKMGKTTLLGMICTALSMVQPNLEIVIFAQVKNIAQITLDIMDFLYHKAGLSSWAKHTKEMFTVIPKDCEGAMDIRKTIVRASNEQIRTLI